MCLHLVKAIIYAKYKFPGCFVAKAKSKTTAGRHKIARNALMRD